MPEVKCVIRDSVKSLIPIPVNIFLAHSFLSHCFPFCISYSLGQEVSSFSEEIGIDLLGCDLFFVKIQFWFGVKYSKA